MEIFNILTDLMKHTEVEWVEFRNFHTDNHIDAEGDRTIADDLHASGLFDVSKEDSGGNIVVRLKGNS